jgi:fusion and transport protein UGO1
MIDRELAPTTFSIAKFCSSSLALLLKLPLETILRRGQAAVLSSPSYVQALEAPLSKGGGRGRRLDEKAKALSLETIVPLGRYDGVFGTMYAIVNEEGSHPVQPAGSRSKGPAGAAAARKGKTPATTAEVVYRRGQGLDGLWRGWKVSWWGLVGLWAAGVLGGGGDGEF